ncbi:DUF6875 domain-containing protein [Kitasatospora sp. NPDC088264]|uniref:DUF6875 domain-containing protein n=1 Tax=Kitasatospora sp. NPDC088264 TaxID=3155296 RepID=UPI00343B6F76
MTQVMQEQDNDLARMDGLWIRVIEPQSPARHARDFAQVHTWLRQYISRPHDEIGRTGPVCPFIPPALSGKDAQFSFRYDVTGKDEQQLREALEAEMSTFALGTERSRTHTGASLDCRIVVLPATGPEGWRVLDEAYEDLKNNAVAHGLMVGQFHPHCDERAVRNPLFPVSVAPVGLFAIRRMAPHDVLFLYKHRAWFRIYDQNFRAHYERGRVRDPLLRELYVTAVERHGLPELAPKAKENDAP